MKNSKIKHTPTPWRYFKNERDNYTGDYIITAKSNSAHIVTSGRNMWEEDSKNHEANAAFIVKAVNNYNKLFITTERLLEIITGLGPLFDEEDINAFKQAQALLNELEGAEDA